MNLILMYIKLRIPDAYFLFQKQKLQNENNAYRMTEKVVR